MYTIPKLEQELKDELKNRTTDTSLHNTIDSIPVMFDNELNNALAVIDEKTLQPSHIIIGFKLIKTYRHAVGVLAHEIGHMHYNHMKARLEVNNKLQKKVMKQLLTVEQKKAKGYYEGLQGELRYLKDNTELKRLQAESYSKYLEKSNHDEFEADEYSFQFDTEVIDCCRELLEFMSNREGEKAVPKLIDQETFLVESTHPPSILRVSNLDCKSNDTTKSYTGYTYYRDTKPPKAKVAGNKILDRNLV